MINLDIHNVTHVSIETRKVAAHGSIESDYVVHTVRVWAKDAHDNPTRVELTLYGEYGLAEVPFNFIETEDAP